MNRTAHYDAVVIGGGPAGAFAAMRLGRGGARVGLVDKCAFPRDKACGDLIGPRGLRLLDDAGVCTYGRRQDGTITVVGPGLRRVRLPPPKTSALSTDVCIAPRRMFDASVYAAAADAGAETFVARALCPVVEGGVTTGVVLDNGAELHADVLVGADGANSQVARWTGLCDPERALVGFAVRAYVEEPVDEPLLVFWEEDDRALFPGYGWLFPGLDGTANIGVGIGAANCAPGAGPGRTFARRVVSAYPRFVRHLAEAGLVRDPEAAIRAPVLGGWLKLGMIGTNPAAERVLLVGDAAGLVNPLQGEGISAALTSGDLAARSILAGGDVAGEYVDALSRRHAGYYQIASALHMFAMRRPRTAAKVARVITTPVAATSIADGWSTFWGDVHDVSLPGRGRDFAGFAHRVGGALTAPTSTGKWFRSAFSSRSREQLGEGVFR